MIVHYFVARYVSDLDGVLYINLTYFKYVCCCRVSSSYTRSHYLSFTFKWASLYCAISHTITSGKTNIPLYAILSKFYQFTKILRIFECVVWYFCIHKHSALRLDSMCTLLTRINNVYKYIYLPYIFGVKCRVYLYTLVNTVVQLYLLKCAMKKNKKNYLVLVWIKTREKSRKPKHKKYYIDCESEASSLQN